MNQKKVKQLRKEAINFIWLKKHINKDKLGSFTADYTHSPWSNPYKNFIRQYRKNLG